MDKKKCNKNCNLFDIYQVQLYGKDNYQLQGLLHTLKALSDGITTFSVFINVSRNLSRSRNVSFYIQWCWMLAVIKELLIHVKKAFFQKDPEHWNSSINEQVWKEGYHSVRDVLKSQSYPCNNVFCVNILTVPSVIYSLRVLKLNMSEIIQINKTIRYFQGFQKDALPKVRCELSIQSSRMLWFESI